MSDEAYGAIHLTNSLRVAFLGDKVHLDLSSHVDGAYISQGLLLSPTVSRQLAAALVSMADASDAASTPEPDFDAERAAIEAEYDETHDEPEEAPTVVSLMEALEASLAAAKAKPTEPQP
jgi:hypothetical protein